MSIFNFRRGRPANTKASSKSSAKATPESVEVVRKRARQRLIGSAVLVILGVVGFPLLFETQPRPVPVDIPIEIPSRAAVKPAAPVEPVKRNESAAAHEGVAGSQATAAEPVSAQASLHEREELVGAQSAPPAAQPAATVTEPKVQPPAAPAKVEPKALADDGQRARALLDGAQSASAVDARHVVQVGAFADAVKAREVRAKLEKAGLKTYTQMAETKDGKRIRVRVGPYATKAEADKAASKIKSLDLPAAVLTL